VVILGLSKGEAEIGRHREGMVEEEKLRKEQPPRGLHRKGILRERLNERGYVMKRGISGMLDQNPTNGVCSMAWTKNGEWVIWE